MLIDDKIYCLRWKKSFIYLTVNIKHRDTILYSNKHVKRVPLSNYHVNSDVFLFDIVQNTLFLCCYGEILI